MNQILESLSIIVPSGLFLLLLSFFRWSKFIKWAECVAHILLVYALFFKEFSSGSYVLAFFFVFSVLQWGVIRFVGGAFSIWMIPIGVLVFSRILPGVEMGDLAVWFGNSAPQIFASTGLMTPSQQIGLSYLCFRWLSAALSVGLSSERIPLGLFLQYCFFSPAFYVGPMSRLESFLAGAEGRLQRDFATILHSIQRVIWGLTKFFPLSALVFQLTFSRRLMDGVPLGTTDVVIAALAYPVYLFLNFSGFIDVMIGFGGLLGHRIDENFHRPYLCTSVKQFWRTWHMTLTDILKRAVHEPLIRTINRFGFHSRLLSYGIGTTAVFGLMAIWHGSTWNYAVFSALQVVALMIEELLGIRREDHDASENRMGFLLLWFRRILVWLFLAVSFVFFENSPGQLTKVLELWS